MNVEELSMIGPDVDLHSVDAINKKRLLAFINHFIIKTSLFLNKLSKSCEHGLMSLESKIQKLETAIIILESKLNSVPGLDVNETSESAENALINEKKENLTEGKNFESKIEESYEKNEMQNIEAQNTLDPALIKYVKMLQFGVPPPAVKLKMEQEGVDISLCDVVLNFHK